MAATNFLTGTLLVVRHRFYFYDDDVPSSTYQLCSIGDLLLITEVIRKGVLLPEFRVFHLSRQVNLTMYSSHASYVEVILP